MKICYIGDSKNIHTLRFARYFAERGNDIYILDYNIAEDNILDGKIKIFTLKYFEKKPIQNNKEFQDQTLENRIKSISKHNPFFSQVKTWLELSYIWLIGHVYFIPRLPSFILKSQLNSRLIKWDRYAYKAKELIDRIRPNIVHSHYLTIWGFIGARSGFKPIVSSAWGSDVLLAPNKDFFASMRLRYTMKNSSMLTSDAKYLTQKMVNLGAQRSRIKEFPWGVDIGNFFPLQKKRHLPPTIIHTRTLGQLYNVEPFLKSIKGISRAVPGLRVFLKNTGPSKDEVEKMVKELNIKSIVVFLDWLSDEELAYYYRNSHIYISLSKSDSTSVSLLEAMASGCFPIVSDIPGNQEWIEDGINGFLVPLENTNLLTEKIVIAFNNEELRKSAVSKNLVIIKQKAIWDENIKELESVYFSLINGKKKTVPV